MRNPFQFIIILTFLTGCNNYTETKNDRPQSLFRERIANSNLVIYDFSFAGGFVTSSDYTGFAVLDSTVSFSKDRMKELPCTYFSTRPTSSNFKMIEINYGQNPRTEKDTLLTPSKSYTEKIDNIQIDVTEYNDTYGSATTSIGLMEYEFDSFKETTDSLTFYNVTKKLGGREFPSTVSFTKGNIKIIDSLNNDISRIQIDQVIIQRNDIYKPTKPLELVPNQPVIGMATYYFYPKTTIKSTSLTDYGIFKRVE
jgi:hypothetical protein